MSTTPAPSEDAETVFQYLARLKENYFEPAGEHGDLALAFLAAARLKLALRAAATGQSTTPLVLRIYESDIPSLRKFAVSRSWFEVPASNGYEELRMIDAGTGGQFTVYRGKRGIKAVANTGQRAARELLEAWKKGGEPN